ncbi:MAG: glycosyltransferase family 2 protein [Planctomycetota bacterium]
MSSTPLDRIGVVAIGRNEGPRLQACLRSLPPGLGRIVYVDSGSTDGSPEWASAQGAEVVPLDCATMPFTAARARNAGFARLMEIAPAVQLVQFVDGDTHLHPDWMATGIGHMDRHPPISAVFGSVREKEPGASIYNQVCEVEWNLGTAGEARAFAGNVLIRADAVARVGGYNPAVIAAEDDELSVRVRQSGGRIERLPAVMAYHDANITRFTQWWRRARRTGYAYAQVSSLHGRAPERYFIAEVRRTLAWGLAPLVGIAGAVFTPWPAITVLAAYLARAARTGARCARDGWPTRAAAAWGVSCALASLPHLLGLLGYHADRAFGRRPALIEYK